MPNGLLRIPSVQNNKDINHQVNNRLLKQIYTQNLAPSIGSLTENFVKAKSLFSPIYRSNEAVAKYEAVSLSPIKLTQVKKDLDRFLNDRTLLVDNQKSDEVFQNLYELHQMSKQFKLISDNTKILFVIRAGYFVKLLHTKTRFAQPTNSWKASIYQRQIQEMSQEQSKFQLELTC